MIIEKKKLSSKERLLLTINHQEPDYVPISFRFFDHLCHRWKNQFERAEELLSLGIDPTLKVLLEYSEIPVDVFHEFFHPEVTVKRWKEREPGESYPLLFKEYSTPSGKLTTVVRKSEDWPHGDDIPLYSDFSVPRAKKHLISSKDDLEKLKYLLWEIPEIEKRKFYEEVKQIKEFAKKHQILVEGWQKWGGDTAVHLCGTENLILLSVDDPEFMDELMGIISRKAMKVLEILIDVGVDVVVRRSWYETTDFWSPTLYRRYFKPQLKREIELCHQSGVKFAYGMTSGLMPLLQDFQEMGIDILYFIDPLQGKVDIKELKKAVGDKICLRGGVNSWITVERGSKEEIDQAVKKAIDILAPGGGFILSAADAVGMQPNSWDKFLMMVDSWKKYRDYPIQV